MTERGEVSIKLKRSCPRCQGGLERFESRAISGQSPENAVPKVRCSACGVEWPDIRAVITEARLQEGAPPPKDYSKVSLADLKGILSKVKAGVRAGRNVAGSVRAISGHLAGIVGRIRTLEKTPDKQEVVAQVGQDVEGIVDQVMLAMEHIEDGKQGKVGPEPQTSTEETGDGQDHA